MDVILDTGPAAADISRWAANLGHDVALALGDHAGRVVDRTKSSLPRRTGRLAASVAVRQAADAAAAVMTAPYARYAEYGGRGFPSSTVGNYLGAASRGLEPQLATTAATATERSIASYRWSRA
jgi:hypothetical protein